MAQSPAGKPRKTPKPAASKKVAGSSASKPHTAPPVKRTIVDDKRTIPPGKTSKKPAPPDPAAPKKRVPAKKAAAKSPSPALADTKPRGSNPEFRGSKSKPRGSTPTKPRARPATGQDAAQIDSEESTPQLGLTPKIQRFVEEYLVDLNGTQAAIRAGYSAHTATVQASQLLSKLNVQAAVAEARKAQQERTGITADKVLREIAYVALGDARELSEVYKGCCRHCWGEGHKRQRTIGEMNKAMEQWQKDGKMPADFDEEGGIGYDPHRPPHPECPDCMGQGHARTVIKDTRFLSPAAVALYAGAEDTKYGVKVHTHSKMAAVEMLNKYLGLYDADNKQKADPLSALLTRIANENGNGFRPVAVDPEHPDNQGDASNGFKPQQDPGDGDDS